MVLMVTVEDNPSASYAAYALGYKFDLGSFRPIAGVVNLNLASVLPESASAIGQLRSRMGMRVSMALPLPRGSTPKGRGG